MRNKIVRKFLENKGATIAAAVLLVVVCLSILAPVVSPYDPLTVNPEHLRLPPVWSEGGGYEHFLGTDSIGRDVLSRLIHGARVSLGTGLLVVILSLSFGMLLGTLAGYFSGWVDSLITRMMDILMSLPSILLAIVIAAVLGPSLVNGIVAVSIVALPGFVRVIRAAVMAEKAKLYTDASQCLGASHFRTMVKHILPNCLAPVTVQATLGFSDGLLNVAALGFLGLGAQGATPEWGLMLAGGKGYMSSNPWLVTLPGLCILVVVLCFNILGDGLRDAFDPKTI